MIRPPSILPRTAILCTRAILRPCVRIQPLSTTLTQTPFPFLLPPFHQLHQRRLVSYEIYRKGWIPPPPLSQTPDETPPRIPSNILSQTRLEFSVSNDGSAYRLSIHLPSRIAQKIPYEKDATKDLSSLQKTVFPARVDEPVSEFIGYIKHEFPHLSKCVYLMKCNPDGSYDLDSNGVELVQTTFTNPPMPCASSILLKQVLKGEYVLVIRYKGYELPLRLDKKSVISPYEKYTHALSGTKELIESYKRLEVRLEKAVDRRVMTVLLTGLFYCCAQLGVIVFLTYDIGWDVMEPVSYILGGFTSILAANFYVWLKREYTFENLSDWLGDIFWRRLAKKHGFDEVAIEKANKQATLEEKVVNDLKYLQPTK